MWLRCAKPLWRLESCAKSLKPPWMAMYSLSSYSDCPPKKGKAAPLQETRMRDRFTLYAKGGDGGGGCMSYRKSRHEKRGRPDGGNGGRGGDVILECSPSVWDFRGLQNHINAARGGNGASKNMIGTRGEDKVAIVPVGTVIHVVKGEFSSAVVEKPSSKELDPWELPGTLATDQSGSNEGPISQNPSTVEAVKPIQETGNTSLTEGSEESVILKQGIQSEDEQIRYNAAELTVSGQRIIIARGGEGGSGNMASDGLKKSKHVKSSEPSNVEPTDKIQPFLKSGEPGAEAVLILELKSIADVGLVGMPNAGKSTLLGALSRARPAIGHYAFTTLRPNLGNMNFDDFLITVADIPGLIKGAHVNRGLGHAFLRHIERTKVLAYVVDLAAGLDELEHHQEGLSERPSLIVANKIDEEGTENVLAELRTRVNDIPIYPVCAVLEENSRSKGRTSKAREC
ncbi:hypothetical protein ACFE04_021185 [Oxalis oulophora]